MDVRSLNHSVKNSKKSFYCICSNLNFEEISNLQKSVSLPFPKLISTHTRCNEGCGSCIERIGTYLEERGLFYDRDLS